MKDILVDNSVSKNLVNPLSDSFKEFYKWLYNEGYLVLSNKLQNEYGCGNQNIAALINHLAKNGRINQIKNDQLNTLKFPKRVEKNFLSNFKDRVHIKAVILSNRKMCLSIDKNLISDICSLPKQNGIKPFCADCPSKVNYK